MDPFKTLGVAPRPIKCESDLEQLRNQAKKKFARFMKEKNKFEAKKVLEAFESIKKTTKDSENKILGRTRKERELDKHFNHQTKEIKKNKPLQRLLRKERKGGEKIHLPGDKERVGGHHRRRKHPRRDAKGRKIRHRRARTSKAAVGVLHGLQRLKMSLPHRSKFAKVMQLVYRWCKEYMDAENREYVFQVLQEAVDTGFVAEDPEGRQIVIQIFEYVLSYWKDWFEQSEDNQMLARYWRISTILACRCSTDDSFTFTSTVARLSELLEFLRENQHRLRSKEDMKLEDLKAEMKAELKEEKFEDVKLEAKVEENEDGTVAKEEPADEPFEQYDDVSSDDESTHCSDDSQAEDTPATPGDICGPSPAPSPAPSLAPSPAPSPGPSPPADGQPKRKRAKRTFEVESGDEAVDLGDSDGAIALDSGDDAVDLDESSDVEWHESAIDLDVGVKEEWSDAGSVESDSDSAEGVRIFAAPSAERSLSHIREHFVDSCMAALMQTRNHMWARSRVDSFFQEVYYKRDVFTAAQLTQIEAWQARIKVLQKSVEHAVGEANNPLEAQRPVIDSREWSTEFMGAGDAWAGKQTLDARDKFGGSKTLR